MAKGEQRFSLKGAQHYLAQEMAYSRITRDQFIKGVGNLSKLALGDLKRTSFTPGDLGLGSPLARPQPKPRPTITGPGFVPTGTRPVTRPPSTVGADDQADLARRRQALQNRLRRNRSLARSLSA